MTDIKHTHTKLPWRHSWAHKDIISMAKTKQDIVCDIDNITQVNAEFIIKAVNSFYEREELIREMKMRVLELEQHIIKNGLELPK
jgi:BRCT domain type II-containing protein